MPGIEKDELSEALGKLCMAGDSFDSAIAVLQRHPKKARHALQGLLHHSDPAWRRGAATAMARLQSSPRNALPHLLKLLRNPDASVKIAAVAAIEHLPPATRRKAVPSIVRLLVSRPLTGPSFTQVRSNLPRAVAAYFLGAHGGSSGLAALRRVARRRNDPIIHHVDGALEAKPPAP